MHATTKETDENGAHILTTVIEADGAAALCSEQAKLIPELISISRTSSGGIELKVAIKVIEPTPPASAPVLTPEEQAVEYLKSKDFGEVAIKSQLERFGVDRILAARDREAETKAKQLDSELEAALTGKASPVVETVN